MAGSRKKPLQVPVVQLFERVGKVSRQHVSRRQFFGVAHGRSGQACRSVSATRLLSACRLEQIRRLLLRATRWHAANYAATDKMQQVGQQPSNKKIRCYTHELRREGRQMVMRRVRIDCGFAHH